MEFHLNIVTQAEYHIFFWSPKFSDSKFSYLDSHSIIFDDLGILIILSGYLPLIEVIHFSL